MPLVKILRDYENAEGWAPGDIVDVTNPWRLIDEGKVALVDERGHVVSQDHSMAKKLVDNLGQEESLKLAMDILKKQPVPVTVEEEPEPEPVVEEEAEEEVEKFEEKPAPKRRGRPKGSKNKK